MFTCYVPGAGAQALEHMFASASLLNTIFVYCMFALVFLITLLSSVLVCYCCYVSFSWRGSEFGGVQGRAQDDGAKRRNPGIACEKGHCSH